MGNCLICNKQVSRRKLCDEQCRLQWLIKKNRNAYLFYENLEEAKKLYLEHDWSLSKISKKYDCCVATVSSYFKSQDIEIINRNKRVGNKNANWKGYGGIGGKYWSEIKCDAKKRNIEVLITIEEAWNQYIRQNGKCALSGLDIPLECHMNNNDYRTKISTASLDRIDSNLCYTIDNIQWVHKKINKMKMQLQDPEFIHYCCLIAKHSGYCK